MNRLPWICSETQECLRDEWEDRRSCLKRADSFEVRLEEARAEHACRENVECRLRAEMRLHVETQELGQLAEELRKGDQLFIVFIERDRELAEMSSQFAELQTLFDEASHQLYTECKRIEGVQETVNACVKQKQGTRGHPSQA